MTTLSEEELRAVLDLYDQAEAEIHYVIIGDMLFDIKATEAAGHPVFDWLVPAPDEG